MYNAFISYSHAADGKLAPALQTALEKFAKPWYRVRYLNVFRDEASLSAAPHLWTSIQEAIDKSEYLIYMASPASALSKWTIKEIEYWLTNKPIEKLLIVLTDGNIVWDDNLKSFLNKDTNSLPDILENKFTEEPFYIDLRTVHTQEDLSLNNLMFKKEVLKLAAQLHGKEPKDLASEELFAHRKVIMIRNAAIALLTLLFIAASGAAWLANKNANEATKQKNIAINERNIAQANYLISEAQNLVEDDPTLALRLEEQAMKLQANPSFVAVANKTYRENFFYKIIGDRRIGFNHATFTNNAKSIVTSGSDGIMLWDLAGKPVKQITNNLAALTLEAASPDGKYIFVTSGKQVNDTTTVDLKNLINVSDILKNHPDYVRMLDMNGSTVQEFKGHTGSITCIAVSPDSKQILTGSFDSTAILWNLDGTMVRHFKVDGYINSVSFSPDAKYMLIASISNSAKLFNVNGKVVKEFNGDGIVNSAVFSPDGKKIFTGLDNKKVMLWDINGKLIRQFTGLLFPALSVALSRDGNSVLAASGKKAIIWDVNGNFLGELKGDSSDITNVEFAPGGQSILTTSNNSIMLWDLFGKLKQEFKNEWTTAPAIAFSPDGNSLLTWDISAHLWNLNGKLIKEFENEPVDEADVGEAPKSVAFSPDSKYLLTNYLGFTPPRLWSSNGKFIHEFKVHPEYFSLAVFSPDGRYILITTSENLFELRQANGTLIREFSSHTGRINCMAFSPDNKYFVTGSEDGACILWDMEGKQKKEFKATTYEINSIAFSPDGQTIVTGSSDRVIRIWNVDGKLVRELKGHLNFVTSVAFSPDGKSILSGSWDRTAKLWDLSGNILQEFKGHLDDVNTVIFSKDGKYVATSSSDGIVRLWSVEMPLKDFLNSDKIEPLSTQQKKKYGIK
jgi:WD40 repeat protein